MDKHFLKYQNETEANNDLLAKGVIEEIDGILQAKEGYAVDRIGSIPDKASTEENIVLLEGYHLNIYTDLPLDFGAYETSPNTPFRDIA